MAVRSIVFFFAGVPVLDEYKCALKGVNAAVKGRMSGNFLLPHFTIAFSLFFSFHNCLFAFLQCSSLNVMITNIHAS